jgi:hypothetical protein
MLRKFEQFIRERQYLMNVSPATIQCHAHNLKWLRAESPSQQDSIRYAGEGPESDGCELSHQVDKRIFEGERSPLKIPNSKSGSLSCPRSPCHRSSC